MSLNFVGEDVIKHEYEIDSISGDLTITFKDQADAVIDTMVIESLRYRAFIGAMDEVAKVILNDLTPNLEKSRTNMDKNALTATTEF